MFGTFSGAVFFSLVAFIVGSLVFLATVFVSSMIMGGSETASRELIEFGPLLTRTELI